MAIVKGRFEDQFVTVFNATARDTSLSLQARGLLLYLLSLPGDWSVSRKHLAKENGVNPNTIQKYINELKINGYVEYVRTSKNGRFFGGDYHVYPTPQKHLQKGDEPSKYAASTTDLKNGSVENVHDGNPTHIQRKSSTKKEKEEKKRTTTTREIQSEFSDPDYDKFLIAFVATLARYFESGEYLPSGSPSPTSTWTEDKALWFFDLYGSRANPADCALLALTDWTKHLEKINGKGRKCKK